MDALVPIRNKFLIYKLTSDSTLSVSHIRRALSFIIQKHIIFRTKLSYDESQSMEQNPLISSPLFSLEMTHIINNDHLNAILLSEKIDESLFNLKEGRIFRCHLLYHTSTIETTDRLIENDMVIFNFHHSIVDDNSLSIFINELSHLLTLYELNVDDEGNSVYLNNTLNERSDKWSNMKKKIDEVLTRLANSSNKEVKVSKNDKLFSGTHTIDEAGVKCLRNIMSMSNTEFFELSLAGIFAFLFKTSTNTQDLCTAVAVDTRIQYGLQDMIGPFTNIVPCHISLNPYETFSELCTRLKEIFYDEIMSYSQPNYDEILKNYQLTEKSHMRTLLIVKSNQNDTIRTLNESDKFKLNLIERSAIDDDCPDFDVIYTFTSNEQDGIVSIDVKASSAVYEQSEVVLMAQRLKQFFDELSSTTPLFQLSALLPQEVESIHSLDSDLERESVHQSLIGDAFIQQALAQPQKLAVILDEQCISYGELLYHAQYLAQYLITKNGVKQGDIVTQYVNGSIEMVIGILGILLAGATYCPLSPDQPLDRVSKLVYETQCKCILAHSMTASVLPFSTVLIDSITDANIFDDRFVQTKASVEDVAYIIFTSGSTGTPKGVKISHQNFGTCVAALEHLDIIAKDRNVLQLCSVTFDIHVLEILGTMWSGGCLILLRSANQRDMRYILSMIQEKEISTIFTVPTIIAAIAECLQTGNETDCTCLSTLRILGSGGEPLFPSLVDRMIPLLPLKTAFYNFYGPAECTPISSAHMIRDSKTKAHSISVGRPIPGYKFRILDENLQFVIPGQVGELFIGGNGVFEGYLHQPDLTKKVRLLLEEGGIYYQTGDLVRYNINDRRLYYEGRKDFQVKIRGQRIELGEIESILMKIVTRCVVIKTVCNNEEHLVAYIEPKINLSILRHHCTTYLPLYMVPSLFLTFDNIPVNQNGKIDRKALPPPDFSCLLPSSEAQTELLTEMEQRLATIWRQILPYLNSNPSKSASFFSLGGNSLSLMRLYQKYQTEFPIYTTRLTFHELLHQATISEHANLLLNEKMSNNEPQIHPNTSKIVEGESFPMNLKNREEKRNERRIVEYLTVTFTEIDQSLSSLRKDI